MTQTSNNFFSLSLLLLWFVFILVVVFVIIVYVFPPHYSWMLLWHFYFVWLLFISFRLMLTKPLCLVQPFVLLTRTHYERSIYVEFNIVRMEYEWVGKCVSRAIWMERGLTQNEKKRKRIEERKPTGKKYSAWWWQHHKMLGLSQKQNTIATIIISTSYSFRTIKTFPCDKICSGCIPPHVCVSYYITF